MLMVMQLINRMIYLEYTKSEIINALQDLEANTFDSYIQETFQAVGFEPLTAFQVARFSESVSKWESALSVILMKHSA